MTESSRTKDEQEFLDAAIAYYRKIKAERVVKKCSKA